jgi:essential nuclear protein 1
MPHTSAALLKIAEMEYSGSNSYFIKVILQKKYSLPNRVIQGICDHFSRFTIDERQLPVLWHQSLLTFVQLYGREIPHAEKENLALLTQNHVHGGITPVVRKHLFESSK